MLEQRQDAVAERAEDARAHLPDGVVRLRQREAGQGRLLC